MRIALIALFFVFGLVLSISITNAAPQITITSPINNTVYSTTSVDLNYTLTDASSINWTAYSLDSAANVTTRFYDYEQDAENASSYDGGWSTPNYPATNAFDENWGSSAYALNSGNIYENYTISGPSYVNLINITLKRLTLGAGTNFTLYVFNYTGNVWDTKLIRYNTGGSDITETVQIQPISDYIDSNGIFSTRSWVKRNSGEQSRYYESKIYVNYKENAYENTTTLTGLSDGSHNITVYANDTFGNMNSTIRYFSVDTTLPQITIQSPTNTTYATSSIWANITLNEAGSWCGRSLDSAANVSLSNTTGNWNNLMSISDGSHSIKFYCNDTGGNMGSTSQRIFTVNTTPALNISLKPSKSWWSDLINTSGAILASGQSLSDITVTVEINNQIKCTDQTDANGLWTCTFNAPNELGSYTVRANITLSGNATSATATLRVAPSWGYVFSGTANRFAHQVPILIQEPSGRIHWVWVTVVAGIA